MIIMALTVLSGCQFDLYYGKRPFDYGNAKWVCEEPSAWFVVDRDAADYHYPKGEITLDDRSVQVGFRFVYETDRVFIDLIRSEKPSGILDMSSGYEELLSGKCVFSPEKLIIEIDPKSDTLFNGKYDKISFVRTQITQ